MGAAWSRRCRRRCQTALQYIASDSSCLIMAGLEAKYGRLFILMQAQPPSGSSDLHRGVSSTGRGRRALN